MGQKLFCWKSKEEDKKKRRQKRVIGIGAALIAALLFLLTEDMSQSVALTDSWTAAAALPVLINALLLLAGKGWEEGRKKKMTA